MGWGVPSTRKMVVEVGTGGAVVLVMAEVMPFFLWSSLIMFVTRTPLCVAVIYSFSLLHNIPLYLGVTIYFSIPLLLDTQVGFSW